MPQSLIKIRVFRQPKQKITHYLDTGDWKLGVQTGDAPEKTAPMRLDKDRALVNLGALSSLISSAITRALKSAGKKITPTSALTKSISKRVVALWPGEISEGAKTWLSVDFVKEDDGTISCTIRDEFSDESETTAITEENPLKNSVDKITGLIASLVKRPVKNPNQSELFAPVVVAPPQTPSPPTQTAAPPQDSPQLKQMDMFSESKRDYRDEIRIAAYKKETPE